MGDCHCVDFALVVVAPDVVNTIKNNVNNNFRGVYQEVVQLCFKTKQGELTRGRVCHQRGYPI